jgi:hypothetical protein
MSDGFGLGTRRALVLSGGGAKAVWQVGACQHLIGERRYWFDVIAGVSAGAVNGTTLAQAHDPDALACELEHLRSVWFGLRGSGDIYRRHPMAPLAMVLGRRSSLHDVGPLRGVLAGHIDPPRVAASPVRLRIGYVDLRSGRYQTAGNEHPRLRDAVLASCAVPLFFPPVPLCDGRELGVDGGVRRAIPLADALNALAESGDAAGRPAEVWVLAAEPLRPVPQGALRRCLSAALHPILRPTRPALPPETAPADVRVRVLHPRQALRGATLDFDPGRIRAWYDDGLRTAREVEPAGLAA